ncbi:MAG: hypothetical protein K1X79_05540 [Oligoflexia bacterium]|nr:hypothetical protein [Oligoflexia bacterium]
MSTIVPRQYFSFISKISFVLIITLLMAGCGGGSSGVGADYQGRVLESVSGAGIPDATVTILETGDFGKTDQDGNFLFKSEDGLTNPTILVEASGLSAQAKLGQDVPPSAATVAFNIVVLSSSEIEITTINVGNSASTQDSLGQAASGNPNPTKGNLPVGPNEPSAAAPDPTAQPTPTAKPSPAATSIPMLTVKMTITVQDQDGGSGGNSGLPVAAQLLLTTTNNNIPLASFSLPAGRSEIVVSTQVPASYMQHEALLALSFPGAGKIYSAVPAAIGNFMSATVVLDAYNRPAEVLAGTTGSIAPTETARPEPTAPGIDIENPESTPTKAPTAEPSPTRAPSLTPPGSVTPPDAGTAIPTLTPTANPTRTPKATSGPSR